MILMNVKIAVAALRSAKLRTILTMMGIIVGVASVTLIMALGEGIKRQVTGEITKLGTNIVQIRPGKIGGGPTLSSIGQLGSLGPSTLTKDDVEALRQTPGVAAAAPLMVVTGSVARDNQQIDSPFIVATTPDLPHVLQMKLTYGEFLNPAIQNESVVLGRNAALKLLGTDNQVGGKVQVRGQDFTVIGILDGDGAAATFGGVGPSLADIVFIPLAAGQQAYDGAGQIQEVEVKLEKGHDSQTVVAHITQTLRDRHQGQQDFSVVTQANSLESTSQLIQALTAFTAAIASISLLVGGIGIMNIMLVSVSERTREIGIRKSIGATNGQILSQFLIEAVVISIGGGLIGIALASAISGAIALRFDITPALTYPALTLSFGVSAIVGIGFGIAPALKAARKDPIEALRHE